MVDEKVTKEQAEAVLSEVKEVFASYVAEGYGEPKLVDGAGHSQMASYVIVWDEGAPECWTQRYRTTVEGVFPDAINNVILGLYIP